MSGEVSGEVRGHVLVIEPDTAYADRFPDFPVEYRWRIECANVEKCGGWTECPEPHEVDGTSAADGPWDALESAAWCDEDYFTFHGVEHEWHDGYGWTVPFEGCVVAATAEDQPISPMRPGRWVVHDDWDDEWVYLTVVSEIHGPPTPPTTTSPREGNDE